MQQDFHDMFGVEVERKEGFVDFHCHTSESNTKQPDGIVDFKHYVYRAVELGHKCVSTCEHGSSGDLLDKFYWKDKVHKLHYTLNGERLFKPFFTDKDKYLDKLRNELLSVGATDFEIEKVDLNIIFANEIYFKYEKETKRGSHLVLLAKNKEGMIAINKANVQAIKNRDGFWGIEELKTLNPKDVVVSTACLASPIRDRSEGHNKHHDEVFEFLYSYFGENLYLEVQANSAPEQAVWNKELVYKAQKYGLKLIAGCDSHYIYPEQYRLRKILLEVRGITYEEEDTMILDYPSRETLEQRFRDQGVLSENEITEAINNTLIFENGTEGFEFNYDIKIPSVYKIKDNEDKDFLKTVYKGFERLTQNKDNEDKLKYFNEIQKEVSVISEGGMTSYLMTASKIVELAQKGVVEIEGKRYSLPVGMETGLLTKSGRGSGGSSELVNCLGLTTMDRLDSEVPLIFERFISLDRLKAKILMDLDCNVSNSTPFLEASKQLLGEENAYFMVKKDTLADVSSVKLVAKYFGYPIDVQEELSSNRSKYEKDEKYKELFELSDQLNGVTTGITIHPCACCLYDKDLDGTFGLIRMKDGSVAVPITGTSADTFKFLKLDFLTVTTWTLIDNACKDAKIEVPDVKELAKMVYSKDSNVFKIASDGVTATVSQFNTPNGRSKIMEYKPTRISEISDLSAGLRPGAQSILDMFLKRTNFKYGVDVLDDYLASSTGCGLSYMLYQEQAMELIQKAGISLSESYVVLKAISKKKEDVIMSYREKFIDGFTKYILNQNTMNKTESQEVSLKIWEVIYNSSAYSFNASHSYAYAFDAVYALWLKDKYTFSYYKSALDLCMNKKDETKDLLSELPYFNITLSPPVFGNADLKYSYDKENRVMFRALNSLSGIGDEVTRRIIEMGKMDFKYFVDLLIYVIEDKEFKLDKTKMRNLILVGFFKKFGSEIKLLKIQKEFLDGANKYKNSSKFPDKREAILLKKREALIEFEKTCEEIWLPKVVSIRYQLEVMGISSDVVGDDSMKDWYFVTKIEGDTTRKIYLYDVTTGEEKMLKYQAKLFRERPLEEFQLIKVLASEMKPLQWISGYGEGGKPIWEKDETRLAEWLQYFDRKIVEVN